MAVDITKSFFINAIDNLVDPMRNTRWRVFVPDTIWNAVGIKTTNGPSFNADAYGGDFFLHVKTAKIPEITITEGAHYYMGFLSNYPINAKVNGEMPFETIMLEDIRAYEAMLGWSNACINTGLLMPGGQLNAGTGDQNDRMTDTGIRLGLGSHKDVKNIDHEVLRNQTVKVELFNWMTGSPILTITLINAWPKAVSGADLTYKSDASLVNFNFTLIYDRWNVVVHKYDTERAGNKEIG